MKATYVKLLNEYFEEQSLPFMCWSPDEKLLVVYEPRTSYISFIDLNLQTIRAEYKNSE